MTQHLRDDKPEKAAPASPVAGPARGRTGEVRWARRFLVSDEGPGVPEAPVLQLVCAACGARSPAAAWDRVDVVDAWATAHADVSAGHLRYRAETVGFWRVVGVDGAEEPLAPAAPPGPLEGLCGAVTRLPGDMLASYREVTGRDLSDLMVLCVREPGHEPGDGHRGAVLDSGTYCWR
ncbi:hypothetical protein ACFWPV_32410 [Streptomyces uncialis]|uniref:DUF7848 domain-containing protein n=1 Tax=Streptomyces uncialis TaxID=1048205 RepID=UPI00364B3201